MTERDLRTFKRLLYLLPVITLIASLLIQWGSWQANSANVQKQFSDQKEACEKRFEQIDREKADAALMESKFDNIDWKLDLIMKNLGVANVKRSNRDTI
jgi:predicted DNA-binding WGR domain protein